MLGRGLRRAALAALVVAGMAAAPVGAARAQSGAQGITVTPLVGPDDRPMISADHINDAGLITGEVLGTPVGPGLAERAVVRQRDVARYLGGFGVTVYDVSERGQVVGQQAAFVAMSGFSWQDGVWTTLADPPPGDDPNEYRPFFLTATGVNERGQVIGLRVNPAAEPLWFETAVWQDGAVVASMGRVAGAEDAAQPADLNDRGLAVVNVPGGDGTRVAAVWRIGGGVTELGTLGGAQSLGLAIDERGRVAGVSETATGDEHAFLWQRGRMVDLGTLGGATSTVGEGSPLGPLGADRDEAVNERGEVVGTSETASGDEHAFLWRRGRMIDLGTLGGATSQATAINDHGQVVGHSATASGEQHAFLWQDGEMIDLGALAGGGESEARDINDRGQIVGRVGDRAVLWTAPPVRR